MSNEPVPQRMSDADRDAAVAMLRDHFEAGRLDQTEFSDRLEKALAARYAADLAPLFGDLPDPRPNVGPLGYSTPAMWSGSPFPQLPPQTDSMAPPFPQSGVPPYAQAGYSMEPRPDALTPATTQSWLPMARKLIWPVAIVIGIFSDAFLMWLVIAMIGSIVLGQLDSRTRKPPPYLGR